MSGLNEADKEAIDNDPSSRQARGFCKDSYGVFCMLYNALAGSKVIFTYQSKAARWFLHINLTKVRYLEVKYLLSPIFVQKTIPHPVKPEDSNKGHVPWVKVGTVLKYAPWSNFSPRDFILWFFSKSKQTHVLNFYLPKSCFRIIILYFEF